MQKLIKLDGLRAILILLVFLNHAKYTRENAILNLGQVAVYYFFILSGFLISIGVTRAIKSENFNRKFVYKYSIKRLFRIYPMYFGAFILIVLLGAYSYSHMELLKNMLFLQRGQGSDYLLALPGLNHLAGIFTDRIIISQSWTLVIEMRFYIIVIPVVYFLLHNFSVKNFLKKFIGFLIVVNVFKLGSMLYAIKYFDGGEMYGIHMPLFYFDLFLAGILVSVAISYEQIGSWFKKHTKIIQALALLSIPLAILADADVSHYFATYLNLSINNFRTLLILPSAITGFCTMYLLVTSKTKLDFILEWSPLVYLGTISYSFYVLHNLIIKLIGTETIQGEFTALVITILISSGCYHIVEKNFIDWGHKIAKKI